MLSVIAILSLGALLIVAKYLYQFAKNYVNISRTGLPFIVIPVDQNNTLWMVSSVGLRPWMKKHLPTKLYARVRYAIYGWEYQEKLSPFHMTATDEPAVDKTFMLCGPGRAELWTASPTLASQILLQPSMFQQLDLTKLFVGLFGENVLTAEGDEWTKQRKVVATAITERISPIVWAESVRQTSGLLNEVCAKSHGTQGETMRLFDMIKLVTINTLLKAGMGVGKEWTLGPEKQSADGEELSYMDAVKSLNNMLAGPIIIPSVLLRSWPSFMPDYQNFRQLGYAKELFPKRTREMIDQEKQSLTGDATGAGSSKLNFMRSLLKASSEMSEEGTKQTDSSSAKKSLSDEDIVSNLYLFTAAGYDTTANTVSYAVTLLMRYPKWQKWLFEEVDDLAKDMPHLGHDELMSNYQAIFPRCPRILAFMFETMRLFSPLIHLAKFTGKPQEVVLQNGRQIVIPAGTNIYINIIALHLDAAVWRDLNPTPAYNSDSDWEDDIPGRYGATAADIEFGGGKRLGDEWRFRPTRWINQAGKAKTPLFQPPRESYVPWSMGPRVCPGKTMAQVEFTAIFFTILSRYRVEAVPLKDETPAKLNERLDWTMQNSISKLTLEMVDVYDKDEQSKGGLKVRLVRRN